MKPLTNPAAPSGQATPKPQAAHPGRQSSRSLCCATLLHEAAAPELFAVLLIELLRIGRN